MIKIDWKYFFAQRVIFGLWWTVNIHGDWKTLKWQWRWNWADSPGIIPWHRCWTWKEHWRRGAAKLVK